MADRASTVVVVGHAARDLVDDDPRGWRLGGSATYVSYALARLGVPVRAVVGVDGPAAAAGELGLLEAAGVELGRVPLESGPIFRNVETPRGRRQECLSVGRTLEPDDVPRGWRAPRAWALVPVLGEIGGAGWASSLPQQAGLVALGWQGMLRAAEAGGPTAKRPPYADPLVARADVVVVGTDDLVVRDPEGAPRAPDSSSWETDVSADPFAPFFPRPGQELVLTAGARGGRLFMRTGEGWRARWYDAAAADVVDWTGAGDVFLAAYLASFIDPTLAGPGVGGRLAFAAMVAAMSIEGPGITASPTRDEVGERLRTIFG